MVGPLVGALGRGLMSGGSKILGPAATRSASAQGLKTGAIKVGLEGKALELLGSAAVSTKGLLTTNKKLMGALEKSSPALSQQMIVLRKSILLFLRPIADIMARFLRPMALWVIRVAMWFYKKLNWFGGGTDSKATVEDRIKQKEAERDSALMEGKPEKAAKLQDEIDTLRAKHPKSDAPGSGKGQEYGVFGAWKWKEDYNEWYKKVTANLFGDPEDGWKLPWKEKWNEMLLSFDEFVSLAWADAKTWASDVWNDYISEGWEGAKTWASDVYNDYIVEGWKGAKTWASDIWNDYIVEGWKGAKTWASDVYDDYIGEGWKGVKTWASDVYRDYIVEGFKDAVNWGGNLWTKLKSGVDELIDKIKEWRPSWWPFEKKATGGVIGRTGMYELHAGEEVVRAGDSNYGRASNSGGSLSVTNYINVSATINNDMDIRTLADRLAELQETQIRRRTSYM